MRNLLDRIESKIVKSDGIHIYFLGQSGYVLKTSETIIYIDPYLTDYIENSVGLGDPIAKRLYPPPLNPINIAKINAVLCTHQHQDHMDPWTLKSISIPYHLFCTEAAYLTNSVEIPSPRLTFLEIAKCYTVNEIEITPILAAHYELYDHKGRPNGVSLMIKIRDKNLYFWGDGIIYDGLIERLKYYKYDWFFAPINGRDWFRDSVNIIGNINIRELASLSHKINIEHLVPNHFDLFDYNGENIDHFEYYLTKFNPSQKFEILNCGDCIRI